MKAKNNLLMVDGIVNLVLGILLIVLPTQLVEALGLPRVETNFYVNIFGGVLFGIGIALILERFNKRYHMQGLGIGGAIAINLCGAGILVLWLLFGKLDLPLSGATFLWSIAVIVFGVAIAELVTIYWKEHEE